MRVTDKYVFFWGSVFSQWYTCTFEIEGMEFNCAEQYMMYKKAKLFGDEEIAELIMKEPFAREQKALGQRVRNFDKTKWEWHCKDIVYDGNYAKFTQNPYLLEELLRAKHRKYVEASPFDKIWGIGMKEYDRGVENPENWKGTNWLGETLTRLKNDLM